MTKIDRFSIPGPAGSLEALLEYDPDAAPRCTVVVCHPHPLYGGTMHTKIVFRAAKAAVLEEIPALRFNFRGVGTSQGEFGNGVGETEDLRAALDEISARWPNAPVILMGFSFGSSVSLRTGASDGRVIALVGMGLPIQKYDFSYLRNCRKPKLFVEGSEDPFGPRAEVEELISTLPPPKKLHWVEGGDHYCTGRLDEVEEVIRGFIRQTMAVAL
ncbi:MAG: alpha/beta hydrolase [Terriglobia bacterium]